MERVYPSAELNTGGYRLDATTYLLDNEDGSYGFVLRVPGSWDELNIMVEVY